MKQKGLVIIKTLNDNGYEARFIGGSVRNTLHNSFHQDNILVKDFDIVTNASYEQVTALFDDVDTRGEQFKVAVVKVDGDEFEIAQYRGESYPEEGSLRPNEVHAVQTLKEDVMRRDFTINGIAEDKDGNIIDYVGGVDDIKNRIIRTIGNSNQRFSEDPLRILRAFRFSAQLGYAIEGDTLMGVIENMNKLSIIPHERVAGEMEKLIKGKNPAVLAILPIVNTTFYNSIEKKQVPFLKAIFSLETEKCLRTISLLASAKTKDVAIRYAMLYSEVDYDLAVQEMKDSMFMNMDDIHFVSLILKHKDFVHNQTSEKLLELLKDMRGKWENRDTLNKVIAGIEEVTGFKIDEMDEVLDRILFKQELPFDGNEVVAKVDEYEIDAKPGKWIGEVIELARDYAVLGQDYSLGSVINVYFDIKEIAQLIKQAKKIVVLTGAGISTESGIPDFKTTENDWKYKIPRTSAMSVDYLNGHPKEFWPIYKDVFKVKVFGDIKPNYGHEFVANLEKLGKNVTVVTQNVDGLHIKAGNSIVYEVHGSLQTACCPKCKTEYDLQYLRDNELPRCNQPKGDKICNFILHPGVVLFGDGIKHYKESFASIDTTDLFLVMGTSLNVGPINQMALKAKHDPYKDSKIFKSVIINRDETDLDYCFDLRVHRGIGHTLKEISKHL